MPTTGEYRPTTTDKVATISASSHLFHVLRSASQRAAQATSRDVASGKLSAVQPDTKSPPRNDFHFMTMLIAPDVAGVPAPAASALFEDPPLSSLSEICIFSAEDLQRSGERLHPHEAKTRLVRGPRAFAVS